MTVNLLMTDEDKNVKNRIALGTYTSTAVFLTSLNYRALAFFFSTILQSHLLQRRKIETVKGLGPCEPPPSIIDVRRKEAHKSINPWLLAGTHLKPLRRLPLLSFVPISWGHGQKPSVPEKHFTSHNVTYILCTIIFMSPLCFFQDNVHSSVYSH